jgi:hypothetical protein
MPKKKEASEQIQFAQASAEPPFDPPPAPAQEEKKSEQEAPKIQATPMIVDQDTQQLVVHNQSELIRVIRVMMKGQALPKTLDTEEKVIAAWQMAASLNLPPAIAIQNMSFVNGVICMWGQLPKALAERTGELEQFNLIYIDEEMNEILLKNKNLRAPIWAAVVQVQREGRRLNEYFFSVDDARTAGLAGKSGPWQNYPKIMLARRAMGHALKFEFPDALMGVPIAEYDFNDAPDLPKDVTPEKSASDLMKEEMKENS